MDTMELTLNVEKVAESRIHEVDFDNIPFGKVFSDHMFVANYQDGQWDGGNIKAFEDLQLSPATLALHYGQSIFEGMKAEKGEDGSVIMFRPELNAARFNYSAQRMCMPTIPEETFVEWLGELLKLDRDWIPRKEGYSLYIRPFMYASDEFIGVQASSTYKFVIFTCPVGPYYSRPVKVFMEDHYVRAFEGGTGQAKAAGNYAPTLYPVSFAKKMGYDQILWTDGIDHKYVQEIGTMNVFFIIDGVVVTPEINGCILEGTTRNTLIHLFKENGLKVEERKICVDEIMAAHDKGILEDCFGAGTAAVITPIIQLGNRDRDIILPDVGSRIHSQKVKQQLLGIKRGEIEDTHGWTVKV